MWRAGPNKLAILQQALAVSPGRSLQQESAGWTEGVHPDDRKGVSARCDRRTGRDYHDYRLRRHAANTAGRSTMAGAFPRRRCAGYPLRIDTRAQVDEERLKRPRDQDVMLRERDVLTAEIHHPSETNAGDARPVGLDAPHGDRLAGVSSRRRQHQARAIVQTAVAEPATSRRSISGPTPRNSRAPSPACIMATR